MEECHQIQKRTLDEAKLLLAATIPCNHHHKKINTEICIGWPRLIDRSGKQTHFFVSGMSSIFALKLKKEPYSGTTERIKLVTRVRTIISRVGPEILEVIVKVVFHGISVVVSSEAVFAITSADEHSMLVNHPADVTSENSM
ncbi:hypothetical protein Rs2_37592 [Raphanus sativus]|nr:hypothetical protein Rs2_37592 [Raphanus sativus]